jgi:hypothetical protein
VTFEKPGGSDPETSADADAGAESSATSESNPKRSQRSMRFRTPAFRDAPGPTIGALSAAVEVLRRTAEVASWRVGTCDRNPCGAPAVWPGAQSHDRRGEST